MVLKFKISPKYFLDDMTLGEVKTLLKYQHYNNQEEWEQTRFLGFLNAQMQSTEKLNPSDILKFSWDKKEEEQEEQINVEEYKKLMNKAENLAKQIYE